MVVYERYFGTDCPFHFQCSGIPRRLLDPWKTWPIGCSETSIIKYKCKGKAIPLQASTKPEVSRRLRLPDFMTVGT